MIWFGLTECRGGFPDAWDMANATYSMALPHPPTNDAAAPSSKSDFGRQRNLPKTEMVPEAKFDERVRKGVNL